MSPQRQRQSTTGLTGMEPGERRRLVAWISTVTVGAGYATSNRLAAALSDLDSWSFGGHRDETPADIYARYAYARARDEINAVLRRHSCCSITPIVEQYARTHLADAVAEAVWHSAFTDPSQRDLHQRICRGLDAATLNLAAQLAHLFDVDRCGPTRV